MTWPQPVPGPAHIPRGTVPCGDARDPLACHLAPVERHLTEIDRHVEAAAVRTDLGWLEELCGC